MISGKVVAIVPARYGSSRFEGKPLATIAGRPMVEWVARRVAASTLIDEVIVAVDDPRVASVCESAGLKYVMTSKGHVTSTERVNEVAGMVNADLYIAVNGDEPLIESSIVERIIPQRLPRDIPFVANLACKIASPAEVVDPTNIKVVWDRSGKAIYFSRNPIPFPRGGLNFSYYKHIGVLAYNREALRLFAAAERGEIEKIEDINELRFVENGVPVNMVVVAPSDGLSVDTPKDLDRVREIVEVRGIVL